MDEWFKEKKQPNIPIQSNADIPTDILNFQP
jgi:hypothetical protein